VVLAIGGKDWKRLEKMGGDVSGKETRPALPSANAVWSELPVITYY
jgi:hypothetical protein